MRILRKFAVNRLSRRILRAFFELELILFFLQIRHQSSRIYKERLCDINAKLLRRFMEMTTTVLPFLGEFPKSGVSGGKLGKEFGSLGIPQHAQILPQTWGILMKIGERKLELNPLHSM